jgi:signal transduction histidine kinase
MPRRQQWGRQPIAPFRSMNAPSITAAQTGRLARHLTAGALRRCFLANRAKNSAAERVYVDMSSFGEGAHALRGPEPRGAGWIHGGPRGAGRATRPDPICVAALTLAGLLVPVVLSGVQVRAPSLRAALETVGTLAALAAAAMLWQRPTTWRRLPDLLLFVAVTTEAIVNLSVSMIPAALGRSGGVGLAAATALGSLLAGLTFAGAALAPRERFVIVPARLASGGGLLALLVMCALGVIATRSGAVAFGGPLGVVGAIAGGGPSRALALGTIALFSLASVRFARAHGARDRGEAVLLSAALLLLAAAVVAQLSLERPSAADLGSALGLRLVAMGLLFAVGLRRERCGRSRTAALAALAERRRVACDLHDGIAQDLALIAAQRDRLARAIGAEDPLVVAAGRALSLCRKKISELSDSEDVSLKDALERMTGDLARMFEIDVVVDVALQEEPSRAVREQLTRIAREATVNAARHGRARSVAVCVAPSGAGLTMRVLDDGRGFDPPCADGPSEHGFGLRSLRERADALGGRLTVSRRRFGGTELRLVI